MVINKTNIFFFLVVVLTAILVLGCEPKTKWLEGSIDRTGKPIETIVYFYDTKEDVMRAYRQFHNVTNIPNIFGFAIWKEYRDENGNLVEPNDETKYTCVIHSIRPKRIDDNATLTLGHEMLHCLYGTYHKK